jgi:hypothetical protein
MGLNSCLFGATEAEQARFQIANGETRGQDADPAGRASCAASYCIAPCEIDVTAAGMSGFRLWPYGASAESSCQSCSRRAWWWGSLPRG